jgi:hypothetical protein
MSNQEMAYDDGKAEATPTIPVVVHDDEEDIVLVSTTTLATETVKKNQDGFDTCFSFERTVTLK